MNKQLALPERIYLDHNATSPVSPAVVQAMLPFFGEIFGNASSIHRSGQMARAAVENARDQLAAMIGVRPAELVFTSGATESINTAIRGVLEFAPEKRRIVTSAVEHSATLDVCDHLETSGYEIVRLPVNRDGTLSATTVAEALTNETALLSLLWVNNETGVIFDIPKIGALARERGVPFHVDATQIAGKGMSRLDGLPIDMLSFSAHKFGGPKGVGGLVLSRSSRVRPLVWGGHHEKGRRGGTENVPAIVGMAHALAESNAAWLNKRQEVGEMRDQLAAGILAGVPDILVNGVTAPRLENTLNICFRNIEGAAIVLTLSGRGIFCSSGSACTASQPGPSHVLTAMNVPGDYVHGSVRLSLSSRTDKGIITRTISEIVDAYHHVARVNLI